MRQVIIGDYNKKIALSITDNAFPDITEELLGGYLLEIALYFYNKFFGNTPFDADTFNSEEFKYILIHKLEVYSDKKIGVICNIHNNTLKPDGWKFLIDLHDRKKILNYTFLEYTVYDKIERLPPKLILAQTAIPKRRLIKKIDIQPVIKIESTPMTSPPRVLSFVENSPLLYTILRGALIALIIGTILASFITALIFSGSTAIIIPMMLASTYSATLTTFAIATITACSLLVATGLGACIGLLLAPTVKLDTPPPNDKSAAFIRPTKETFKLFKNIKINDSCYITHENNPALKNADKESLQEIPVIHDWPNVRSGTCIKLK